MFLMRQTSDAFVQGPFAMYSVLSQPMTNIHSGDGDIGGVLGGGCVDDRLGVRGDNADSAVASVVVRDNYDSDGAGGSGRIVPLPISIEENPDPFPMGSKAKLSPTRSATRKYFTSRSSVRPNQTKVRKPVRKVGHTLDFLTNRRKSNFLFEIMEQAEKHGPLVVSPDAAEQYQVLAPKNAASVAADTRITCISPIAAKKQNYRRPFDSAIMHAVWANLNGTSRTSLIHTRTRACMHAIPHLHTRKHERELVHTRTHTPTYTIIYVRAHAH